jgi:hypothetical protein
MDSGMTEQARAAAVDVSTVERLARIETKLDSIRDERDNTTQQLAGHGLRLDRVERFMWLAVGMSFASGVPAILRAVGAATT